MSIYEIDLRGLEPLVPAYGRDYTTIKQAQADLDKKLDFMTPSGKYINIDELAQIGMKTIRIRYSRLQKTAFLKVQ
jgi:hypothetical protein